jgi:alpha-mannosidase/mannosylglycerate hydrolase
VHPAPVTFPQQGFVSAAGLTVAAPGLPEAEVTPEGVIAITLVRAVGWLARMDLKSRPQVAGPTLPTPEAQCSTEIAAELSLLAGCDPRAVRDAEIGMRAVVAGEVPLVPPEQAMLAVEPRDVMVSALEPALDGDGVWLRLLNPHDDVRHVTVRVGFPCTSAAPIRLDGTPCGAALPVRDGAIVLDLPGHALRTLHIA